MKNLYQYFLEKFISEKLTSQEAARLYNYQFNIDIYNARTELTDVEFDELVYDMAKYYEMWFSATNDLYEDKIMQIVSA